MQNKISILYDSRKDISLNYSLFPILVSSYTRYFDLIDISKDSLDRDRNFILVIFGKAMGQKSADEKHLLFQQLRNKYRKLVFFDDLDGSEIQFFSFWQYFDLYFKKQIYRDKSLYLKEFIGNKVFTDYYYHSKGIRPENPSNYSGRFQGIEKDLAKIHLGWNIGIGTYPKPNSKIVKTVLRLFGKSGLAIFFSTFRVKNIKEFQNKIPFCQARFSYNPERKHIDFQRKLFLEKIAEHPSFLKGRITKQEYKSEIRRVKAVLSPFGYGEICFRDFEAVLNGSVLVKPDMSHLATWPNIFIPEENYVSIDWSGNDLVEKVETLLSDDKKMREISKNAQVALAKSYAAIDQKVAEFVELIRS